MRIRNFGILMVLALLLFAAPAFALNTLLGKGSSLGAELFYYMPVPAEPGDIIDAYVLVTNSGSGTARNVRITLIDNYPFSSDSVESAIKEISAIPGQQSFLAKFKVRIDSQASQGTGNLKLRINEDDSAAAKEFYLPLDILTNDAAISIDRINTNPAEVSPGGRVKVDLHLTNLADSRLRDIAVRLSTQRTVGSTTTALPFAPLGMSLEQRFVEMLADQKSVLSYELIVLPSAESDVYKLPITITFSDEIGNQYTSTDEVSIIVNALPELHVYIEETGLYSDVLSGEITLRFVNKGLSTIKSATATLEESEDYKILASARSVYIGNIESDDYETATYRISANKDSFTIPLKVSYLDALNKQHTQDFNVQVSLFSKKQMGLENGNGGVVVVILILILVVLFFVIKNRRKKKRSSR